MERTVRRLTSLGRLYADWLYRPLAGNALACAASAAIMDVFEQENILDNVNAR